MDGAGIPAPGQGVLVLDEWELPPRRKPGLAAAPVLAIDGFEGPLDWLLDLARTRRIDLARLSIAALIAAFEAALTAALTAADKGPMVLARWGDWLVMAADLTLLRSRMLVSINPAEVREAQDAAERLRRVLLDRAEIGRAVDWLEQRVQLGRDVFGRGQADANAPSPAGRTGDITGLLRACLVAIRLPADAGSLYQVPQRPFWSVSDATQRIRKMLPTLQDEGKPLAAFLPVIPSDAPDREGRCRKAVAATFLAGLELTREGSITVQQDRAWDTIQVRRGQETAGSEAAA